MTWNGMTLVNVCLFGCSTLLFAQICAATTANGSLRLTLEEADPANNHELDYKSGMVSRLSSLSVLLH